MDFVFVAYIQYSLYIIVGFENEPRDTNENIIYWVILSTMCGAEKIKSTETFDAN